VSGGVWQLALFVAYSAQAVLYKYWACVVLLSVCACLIVCWIDCSSNQQICH
jgi:hypothetical protein